LVKVTATATINTKKKQEKNGRTAALCLINRGRVNWPRGYDVERDPNPQ